MAKKCSTLFLISIITLSFLSSGFKTSPPNPGILTEINDSTKVEITTSLGKIVVVLSNKTPLHRDNFIQLVEKGEFENVIFHRVIENFMIQAGEKDSLAIDTNATNYDDIKIPAEINKSLFHKRGALAAARDGNPDRASSPIQFYIVQGKVFNDSLLDIAESRINGWLGEYYLLKDPSNKNWRDSLDIAMEKEDFDAYTRINKKISDLSKEYTFMKYTIPQPHREVYKSIGGTPHLDQNYTVFGEVLEGMNIVDSIAAQPTDKFDRPKEKIKILSIMIL